MKRSGYWAIFAIQEEHQKKKKISEGLRVPTQIKKKKKSIYEKYNTPWWPPRTGSAERKFVSSLIKLPSCSPILQLRQPCPNQNTKGTPTHCLWAVSFIDSVKATANLGKRTERMITIRAESNQHNWKTALWNKWWQTGEKRNLQRNQSLLAAVLGYEVSSPLTSKKRSCVGRK